MADTTALKNRIRAAIKANDNQEITGPVLQQALLDMVDELNGATETEADARQNADTQLGNRITSEADARQNADSTLQTNITNEATTRSNADTVLGQRIGNEVTARQNADTALQNLIDGVKQNVDNGYVYAGIATPTGTPVTGKVFYIATASGTYTNFGGQVLTRGINILKYNGSVWSSEQIVKIDDYPTDGSNGIVNSSGINAEIEIEKKITIGSKEITGVLGPSNTFINVTAGYAHIVIPVKNSDTITIHGSSGVCGFLKSYPSSISEGTSVEYSSTSGYNSRLSFSGDVSYSTPSDAKYFIICVLRDAIYCAFNVLLNGVEVYNGLKKTLENSDAVITDTFMTMIGGIKFGGYNRFTLGNAHNWVFDNAYHAVLSVKPGDIIEVAGGTLMMGFLRSYRKPTINEKVDYSKQTGYTDRISEYGTYICPSDAKYLVVRVLQGSSYVIPDVLKINGIDVVSGIKGYINSEISTASFIAELDAETSDNKFNGLINSVQRPCTLGPSGTWVQSDIATHAVYKIKQGDVIKIGGTGFAIGFLKTYKIPSDNETVDYSSETGYTGRIADTPGTYTCPSDANYLVVRCAVNNDYSQIPSYMFINGVECVSGINTDDIDKKISTASFIAKLDAETSDNKFNGLKKSVQRPCTLGPSGTWVQSDVATHVVYKIKQGDVIKISGTSFVIGFLKSYVIPSDGLTINYSSETGYTGRIADTPGTYTCPSDANYLVVRASVEGSYIQTPISLSINDVDCINGITFEVDVNAETSKNIINGLKKSVQRPCTLGPSGTWVQSDIATHVVYKIKQGDVIKIGGTSFAIGFLKSYAIPYDGLAINYSSETGYTGRIANTPGTYTCPSDANYLVVRASVEGSYTQIPTSLSINNADCINGIGYIKKEIADAAFEVDINAETSKNIINGLKKSVQRPCTLGPSGTWTQSDIATHVVYKIKQGDIIKIEGTSFAIGFLKSYVIPYDGLAIDYSSETGYTGRIADTPGTYTCPSDANYLVVRASVEGSYTQIPTSLSINNADCINGIGYVSTAIYPSMRVIQITDPHCCFTTTVQDGVDNEGRMELMLNMIKEQTQTGKIDAIISTGDNSIAEIISGVRDSNHLIFKELIVDELSKLGIPFIPVVGNHDAYTEAEWYEAYEKPKQYSVDLGSVYFIVLNVYKDSLEYSYVGPNYSGADDKGYVLSSVISQSQGRFSKDNRFTYVDTAYLQEQLSIATGLGKKPIICLHTLDYNSCLTENTEVAAESVTNALSLMNQFGCKLLMVGHSHIYGNNVGSNGIWRTNPSWFGRILDYEYTRTINSAWAINLFEAENRVMVCRNIRLAHNYVDSIGNVEERIESKNIWTGEIGRASYSY